MEQRNLGSPLPKRSIFQSVKVPSRTKPFKVIDWSKYTPVKLDFSNTVYSNEANKQKISHLRMATTKKIFKDSLISKFSNNKKYTFYN